MQEPQSGKANQDDASPTNESWREAEWKCVIERRKRAFSTDAAAERDQEPENLTGLALSGGGIRSALFNDGFLQALSHRGLLRYFDFLCSVSGGGYIAGHLASQSDNDTKGCFHDDKKRSQLGREPETGKVDASRLAGIGGYLSRPFEFIPAYLWSLFFSLSFYLGLLGVIATLAALFWRSFDDVTFREVYIQFLGLNQFGDELLIAFLPAVFFVILMVVGECLLTTASWWYSDGKRKAIKRWHRRFRATMMLTILFALLASIAIYLGNGKSSVRGGSDTVYMNNYVQFIAIAAGVIQIMVFLGRDRLFRSERSEAKGWQRHLQQSVTTIVVMFLTFSMVHWMGREDISEYTTHRDPHLVVGDVLDWSHLAMIREKNETFQRSFNRNVFPDKQTFPYGLHELQLEPSRQLETEGKWHGSLVRSRLNLFGADELSRIDHSTPPPPDVAHSSRTNKESKTNDVVDANTLAEKLFYKLGASLAGWLNPEGTNTETAKSGRDEALAEQASVIDHDEDWWLPGRIVGAAYAYWLCVVCDPVEPFTNARPQKVNAGDWTHNQLKTVVGNLSVRQRQREKFLEEFNQQFQTIGFTRFLISRLKLEAADLVAIEKPKAESDEPKEKGPGSEGKFEASGMLAAIVQATNLELNESHQKELVTRLHMLVLPDSLKERSGSNLKSGSPLEVALRPALTNRLLIEALYPSVVQKHDIASTYVVPPYDQQTRVRWLLGWTMLTFIGLVGGLGPHRVATVFHFYRKQLSLNFLVSSWKPRQRCGTKTLGEIKPHLDGLPYPLILAAALEPSSCNGSYRVAARPFVFSPLASGSFEEGETPIPSEQISFSRNPKDTSLTLADAVTLSGAAVTPLMTQNRWLTLILDFFNTGIGQRVQRNDRTKMGPAKVSRQPLIFSGLICGVVFLVSAFILDLRYSLLLVMPTAIVFCRCWNWQVGSPGLIRSLFLLKETHHESDFNQNQSFYIADGGYVDYLGVSELLRRRCELIVVSDAGANVGGDSLGTLARMCERASAEQGIRFLDLDHEAPIDFGRLEINNQTRLVHQPFICMRVRYPNAMRREGLLVYCQMSITDADPIEIKNIRNLFPSFPDEPTVNQFYNEKQVAAYRALGYHIGSRFCSELHPWFDEWPSRLAASDNQPPTVAKTTAAPPQNEQDDRDIVDDFRRQLDGGQALAASTWSSPATQPLFQVLNDRLLTSYRLACFEEITYTEVDIFGEAIWTSGDLAFPTFLNEASAFREGTLASRNLADSWLERYELNADLRSAYRTAVINDINSLELSNESLCGVLWESLCQESQNVRVASDVRIARLAAHLTCVAVACQEVHRGRPHAAFQVGGRTKLIDLCKRIAEIIDTAAPKQSGKDRTLNDLFRDMDKTIAELIEMRRSIFQGGEHIATISFAQCMSNEWGKLARDLDTSGDGIGNVMDFTEFDNAFGVHGVLSMFEQRGSDQPQSSDTFDLMAAEIRHQLDVGMKEIRLKAIRHGLAKSWFLGYFTTNDWKLLADFIQQDSQKTSGQGKLSTKTNENDPMSRSTEKQTSNRTRRRS